MQQITAAAPVVDLVYYLVFKLFVLPNRLVSSEKAARFVEAAASSSHWDIITVVPVRREHF